jgi:hypothetical protein
MLGVNDPQAGRLKLVRIVINIGLESRPSALGLGLGATERIVTGGLDAGRAANETRRLTGLGHRRVLTLSL